jgi:4-hydroxy-tetrahydrodipicolinate synthase
MRANFIESNPVPVKTAMGILGRCSATLRAPLGPAEPSTRAALSAALRSAGLMREER